jgi:hypothetical protein
VTVTDTRAVPVERTFLALDWSSIIAGALAAAALGFVLHSFAIAFGLSVGSTSPAWRDTSFALVFLSGLYLVLAALAAYGLGGYVVARMRARVPAVTPAVAPTAVADEVEFSDGMHGLIVWALATLVTGFLVVATIQGASRLAPAAGSSAGPAASVAAESLLASDLDRLFRSDRRPAGDIAYARAEAGRILLTTASHDGMSVDDRSYLVRMVALITGLSQPDADNRVLAVAGQARVDIERARHSAVILGFMAGAAVLMGAVAAWAAACAGGRHREGHETPHALLDWGRPYARR